MKRIILFTAMVVVLAVAACASTPTPNAIALATPTLLPSPTSTLTPTPIPPTPTFTPSPTATSTSSPTPTSTETPTPVPTFTLSGVVFFDYNGNGDRDPHEPPIPSVTVQVGSLVAKSGEDGSYVLEGVPASKRQVRLSAESFRYISLSLEAFQAIEEPVSVVVDGDLRRDWGLMEGFLTSPFRCEDIGNVILVSYFDLQPGPGARNYKGNNTVASWQPLIVGTFEDHFGIDWKADEGTPIAAAAPGVVNYAGEVETAGFGKSLHVTLEHNVALEPTWLTKTVYGHLSKILVSVGQEVSRGQVIGLSGCTGTSEPHLHWGLLKEQWKPTHRIVDLDPFRDLANPNSKGYWTKDNDPQCVE